MNAQAITVSMTPAVFHLSPKVLEVSAVYDLNPIVPRGPQFAPLMQDAKARIVKALGAEKDYEAILLTGSGSTAIAAVLGSCLRPDERLMVIRNGAYGERILEFARAIGQPVFDYELPYGVRPDMEKVEAMMQDADAVAMVFGGTSTCTLNPLEELSELTKKYQKKLIIDAISAMFVEPLELSKWGVSAVMGSCNKGLHGHPNLSCAIVSKTLLEEMEDIPSRTPSIELHKAYTRQKTGGHPYTIDPLSVLQLRAALTALEEQGGVAARHAMYQKRASFLREGYKSLGLKIAEFEGQRLQSIGTMLEIPSHTSYEKLAEILSNNVVDGHVFEIYAAQGKLSDRYFRIFHMGHYDFEVYPIFIKALGEALKH